MNKHWQTVALRDLGSFGGLKNGTAFKSEDYKSEGIPLIKIGQFKDCSIDISEADYFPEYYMDEYKNYLLNANDLIIAMSSGTTGKTAIIKDSDLPAFLNQRVGNLGTLNTNIVDKSYLPYLGIQIRKELMELASGSAIPNISKALIDKLKIRLPPLTEQRRIVARIEALAAKVNEAKRLRQETITEIETLVASKEMQIWNTINFKKLMSLNDVTTYLSRGRQSKQGESDHFLIKTQHVQMGKYVTSDMTLSTEVANKVKPEAIVKSEEILIACSAAGCLGRVAFYEFTDDKNISTDTHIAIARANPEIVLPKFLYAYLKGEQGQNQLRSREKGNWQREKIGFRFTELNVSDMRKAPVPVPSFEEQKRIVAYLDNS